MIAGFLAGTLFTFMGLYVLGQIFINVGTRPRHRAKPPQWVIEIERGQWTSDRTQAAQHKRSK